MRRHDTDQYFDRRGFQELFRREWERLGFGPARPPRVTDDGEDDGLTGAPVPRKPVTPTLSGGAALATPAGNENLELP